MTEFEKWWEENAAWNLAEPGRKKALAAAAWAAGRREGLEAAVGILHQWFLATAGQEEYPGEAERWNQAAGEVLALARASGDKGER